MNGIVQGLPVASSTPSTAIRTASTAPRRSMMTMFGGYSAEPSGSHSGRSSSIGYGSEGSRSSPGSDEERSRYLASSRSRAYPPNYRS
jgi:hypothetical protein